MQFTQQQGRQQTPSMPIQTVDQILASFGPNDRVIVRLTKKVAGYRIGEVIGVNPAVAEIYLKGSGTRPACAVLVDDGRAKPRDRSRDEIDGRRKHQMEMQSIKEHSARLEAQLAESTKLNEELQAQIKTASRKS